MHPIYLALTIIFIVIFLATAVLTICALPGWVKIPDTYFKILFSSLLLEVIGTVFVLYNALGSDNSQEERMNYKSKNTNCVILNDEGLIDSTELGMSVSEFSRRASEGRGARYNLVKENETYLVKNKKNQYIGQISPNVLRDSLKLFGTMNMKAHDFYKITYVNDGGWKIEESDLPKICPVKLDISGSHYIVSDSIMGYKNTGGLDKGKRNLHFFQASDGAFYLVRVSNADFSSPGKHTVTFIVIQVKMESKLD
ncbi:MAG: hypothetical protein FWC10_03425 [Lentimicrobiaceae bacterium]|nr:hypothetical protein [Lentimicrobiaceae bacterium]